MFYFVAIESDNKEPLEILHTNKFDMWTVISQANSSWQDCIKNKLVIFGISGDAWDKVEENDAMTVLISWGVPIKQEAED
jgi:hypothetical protein